MFRRFARRWKAGNWDPLKWILRKFSASNLRPKTPTRKPTLSRRDLLQGRLWKLVGPSQYEALVMRYPKPAPPEDAPPGESPRSDETLKRKWRSIAGINIEPVAPTDLSKASAVGNVSHSIAPPETIPVFRPPGAIDEAQFLAGCTRCGECITACPYDAIRIAPPRLGNVAGTPIIDADTQACLMCEDFPCIASCDPGVLIDSIPKVMGTARVTEHLCLAHHHTTCTGCSERCPVAGAITLSEGKPTVVEDVCTGCGVCRYVCPAPENAILLMPAFSRPGLRRQSE